MCKTNTQTSPTKCWRQNLISLGSENSFWEHIKLLLPQTMEAESLSRSPEAPNTIDVLRESLTDLNRPKLPRECKKHLQVFPRMVTTYTQKLSNILCLIIQFELQLKSLLCLMALRHQECSILQDLPFFKLEKRIDIFCYSVHQMHLSLSHSFIQINIPNILFHSIARKISWKQTRIFLSQRGFFTSTSHAWR